MTVFCVAEDRKFADCNFVNEENNKAETLRDQISQVNVQVHVCFILLFEKFPSSSVVFNGLTNYCW